MEIVITGRSALTLHRHIRSKEQQLKVRPVPKASLSWQKLDGKALGELELPALEHLGIFTKDWPLELRVRKTSDRVRLLKAVCCACAKPLPGGSFVELYATGRYSQALLPAGRVCRVLMDSVPLVVLDLAGDMCRLVRKRRMGKDEAIMSLTAIICEFCGTYARDSIDPRRGDVTFELVPATSVAEVRSYLDSAYGIAGIDLARAAVRLAADGLASPMEYLMYAALAFPPRMGGLHIKDLKVNEPLDLSHVPQGKLAHSRLTPDFRVGDDPVAVEYNGEEHLEKYRVRQDKARAQDYAKLEMAHYPLMIEDVRTVDALDKTLRSLVDLLTPYEGSAFRTRALHILRDPTYREARKRLLAYCLPSGQQSDGPTRTKHGWRGAQ